MLHALTESNIPVWLYFILSHLLGWNHHGKKYLRDFSNKSSQFSENRDGVRAGTQVKNLSEKKDWTQGWRQSSLQGVPKSIQQIQPISQDSKGENRDQDPGPPRAVLGQPWALTVPGWAEMAVWKEDSGLLGRNRQGWAGLTHCFSGLV